MLPLLSTPWTFVTYSPLNIHAVVVDVVAPCLGQVRQRVHQLVAPHVHHLPGQEADLLHVFLRLGGHVVVGNPFLHI